jgi:hypothetical protein
MMIHAFHRNAGCLLPGQQTFLRNVNNLAFFKPSLGIELPKNSITMLTFIYKLQESASRKLPEYSKWLN